MNSEKHHYFGCSGDAGVIEADWKTVGQKLMELETACSVMLLR